jgi:hypothetical protein
MCLRVHNSSLSFPEFRYIEIDKGYDMRKLTTQKFRRLLEENGTTDQFMDKLNEAAFKFPSHCEGQVRFPFLYDMANISVIVLLQVQIIFKGADRTFRILQITHISVDHYISMICTKENQEFKAIYKQYI